MCKQVGTGGEVGQVLCVYNTVVTVHQTADPQRRSFRILRVLTLGSNALFQVSCESSELSGTIRTI